MTAGHDADNLTYSWQARSWENGLNYYDSAAAGPFDGGWTDPKEHINENFAWSHYFNHRDHFIHSHDDDNNVVTVHDRHRDNPLPLSRNPQHFFSSQQDWQGQL